VALADPSAEAVFDGRSADFRADGSRLRRLPTSGRLLVRPWVWTMNQLELLDDGLEGHQRRHGEQRRAQPANYP
jgi:hypothetical protein